MHSPSSASSHACDPCCPFNRNRVDVLLNSWNRIEFVRRMPASRRAARIKGKEGMKTKCLAAGIGKGSSRELWSIVMQRPAVEIVIKLLTKALALLPLAAAVKTVSRKREAAWMGNTMRTAISSGSNRNWTMDPSFMMLTWIVIRMKRTKSPRSCGRNFLLVSTYDALHFSVSIQACTHSVLNIQHIIIILYWLFSNSSLTSWAIGSEIQIQDRWSFLFTTFFVHERTSHACRFSQSFPNLPDDKLRECRCDHELLSAISALPCCFTTCVSTWFLSYISLSLIFKYQAKADHVHSS